MIVTERSELLMKEFFAKGLSGRKIELDEVVESEQDDQSSAMAEIVPQAATMFMAPMTTKSCIHGNQSIYWTLMSGWLCVKIMIWKQKIVVEQW